MKIRIAVISFVLFLAATIAATTASAQCWGCAYSKDNVGFCRHNFPDGYSGCIQIEYGGCSFANMGICVDGNDGEPLGGGGYCYSEPCDPFAY